MAQNQPHMKKRIVVAIASHLLICTIVKAQTFVHNFEEAKTKANTESKIVMMIFSGSDWCKPCIELHETIIKDQPFQHFGKDNLVLLELDFPYKKKNQLSKEQQAHNEQLADRYNPQGVFPLLLLVNENGKVMHKMGFDNRLTSDNYVQVLQKAIKS